VLRRGVSGFNKLGDGSKTVRKTGLFEYGNLRTGNFCIFTFDFGLLLVTRNGGRVVPSNSGDGFLDLVDGFKFIHDMEEEKNLNSVRGKQTPLPDDTFPNSIWRVKAFPKVAEKVGVFSFKSKFNYRPNGGLRYLGREREREKASLKG